MATNTYVAIETKTLIATTSSVSFTSIPQTYTDLILVFNGTVATLDNNNITFNSDTGARYSTSRLTGTGSGNAASSTGSSLNAIQCGEIGTLISTDIIQVQNYSNTTTKKTLLQKSGNTTQMYKISSGTWRPVTIGTSNITTMTITNSGVFQIGSTFTLYGIGSSNIGAPKAFGGTITQDATYTYHTFGASGTFTPTQSLTADCLVIAGGGGGGCAGGGGGAGSLIHRTGFSLTAQNYSISIGSGGAGDTTRTGAAAASGTASTFNGISATGGGGGASNNGNIGGGAGGSGGGGVNTGAAGTASAGTLNGGTGYVFAGGGGAGSLGSGGGGSGQAGTNSDGLSSGGPGGNGTDVFSSWLIPTGMGMGGYIAGGGGGGAGDRFGIGGLGGGGNSGISTNNGENGRVNTGSGAGGSRNAGSGGGGTGGSGIVIIRYAN